MYAPAARPLGIAPAIIAAGVSEVEKLLGGLFGPHTSLEAGVQDQVTSSVQIITSDLGNIATPGTAAGNEWILMRCRAGDDSVVAAYNALEHASITPIGCGYAHQDSRTVTANAVLAIAGLAVQQGIAMPSVFTFRRDDGTSYTAVPGGPPAPLIGSSGSSGAGSTIYQPLPGGGGLNLPVPTSSLLNATIGGIPVLLLAAGVAVLAFSGGRSGRR